jgi:hypothetical protein
VREVIEVTAPTQRRGDERLKVHERRGIEVTTHQGLTVTTPAQTLLDPAATGWPIDRTTHDLAAASMASLDDLRKFARNKRGEPGASALAKALALPHTRSAWERLFLKWVTGLPDVPAPILNDPIGHLTVDCHGPTTTSSSSSTPTRRTAAPGSNATTPRATRGSRPGASRCGGCAKRTGTRRPLQSAYASASASRRSNSSRGSWTAPRRAV